VSCGESLCWPSRNCCRWYRFARAAYRIVTLYSLHFSN
jgi:hypothetical protein